MTYSMSWLELFVRLKVAAAPKDMIRLSSLEYNFLRLNYHVITVSVTEFEIICDGELNFSKSFPTHAFCHA